MMNMFLVIFAAFIGAVAISLGIADVSSHSKYKQCRYYNQTIERCVTELGWEKK